MKLYIHKRILHILLKLYPELFARYLGEYAEIFNEHAKRLIKEKQNEYK